MADEKKLLDGNNAVYTNNGGPVVEQPSRFASPFSGTEGQRNQMRHILHANRKRRLSRTPTPR